MAVFFLFFRRTALYAQGDFTGLMAACFLVGLWIACSRVRSLRDFAKELPAGLACLFVTVQSYSSLGSMMSGRPSESEFYDLVIGVPTGFLAFLGGEAAGWILGAFYDRRISAVSRLPEIEPADGRSSGNP